MTHLKPDLTGIDLAALVARDGVTLRGGAMRQGPCPKCGGKDRFHVKVHQGVGYCNCRGCHGDPMGTQHAWKDAIDYLRWLRGMTFAEAVQALGARVDALAHPIERVQAERVELVPPKIWQDAIRPLIAEWAAYLTGDTPKAQAALRWLHGRGLSDATIKGAQIGYNPTAGRMGDLWIAEGFTLPTVIFGEVWQVRIRRPPAHVAAGKSKYTGITGNKSGLMGADAINRNTQAVIVVGGEFDHYLAQQHAPVGVLCVTFGAEGKRPHPRWLNILSNVPSVFITMDNDRAGDLGAALWAALPQARRARVPGESKDITEYAQSGGDVSAWLASITGVDNYDSALEQAILEWLQSKGYEPRFGASGEIIAARADEEVTCDQLVALR